MVNVFLLVSFLFWFFLSQEKSEQAPSMMVSHTLYMGGVLIIKQLNLSQ